MVIANEARSTSSSRAKAAMVQRQTTYPHARIQRDAWAACHGSCGTIRGTQMAKYAAGQYSVRAKPSQSFEEKAARGRSVVSSLSPIASVSA
jgi:hypothetical protein